MMQLNIMTCEILRMHAAMMMYESTMLHKTVMQVAMMMYETIMTCVTMMMYNRIMIHDALNSDGACNKDDA